MNGDPVSRESLKNFYGYKETFGRDSVWVPVPQELTFITTNNPYDDEDGSGHPPPVMDDSLVHNGMNFDANRDTSDGELARQLAQAAYPAYATHGLEALSAVASQDQYNYAPPPAPMGAHDAAASMQHPSSPQQSHETISQSLDSLLNVQATQPSLTSPPPNIDPRLHSVDPTQQQQQQHHEPPLEQQHHDQTPIHVRSSSYTPVRPPSLLSQGTTGGRSSIRDPELAFLMRDYSEHAGAWMDLFDLGQFFAMTVPILAVDCPLLLYSCAALSAKSLARIGRDDPESDDEASAQSRKRTALWPGAPLDVEGWAHKGRENYDVAISLLRQALIGVSTPQPSSLPEDVTAEMASVAQGTPLPNTDSDELVAATAVLCVYEFLDASGSEWSRHLDGAKSLFDVAKEKTIPLTREPEPVSLARQVHERLSGHTPDRDALARTGPSKGRTAVYWNFARQDMLSAFINNTSTRLDPTDTHTWQNAGLHFLPATGHLCPSNPSHPAYSPATAMPDDTIANALIHLLGKLVNFISAGDAAASSLPTSPLGIRQQTLLTTWRSLDAQLRAWHDGLPPSFRPIALGTDPGTRLEERWFPRPLCASAMQSYHFARIQLLLNKPHTSTGEGAEAARAPGSSLAARHASYASILQQSRFHAREIVAISLGRADEGARIHSVQPLWTAGLVLGDSGGDGDGQVGEETAMWRRTVLGLLRGVERDMGWASGYRVRNLREVWGEV